MFSDSGDVVGRRLLEPGREVSSSLRGGPALRKGELSCWQEVVFAPNPLEQRGRRNGRSAALPSCCEGRSGYAMPQRVSRMRLGKEDGVRLGGLEWHAEQARWFSLACWC